LNPIDKDCRVSKQIAALERASKDTDTLWVDPRCRSAIVLWDFYFRALRPLVVLSFPQLISFSSVFPKPLYETLRRSSDRSSR
jgi:hypothetical protein